MNSAAVVRVIEGLSSQLIPGLNAELRTNLGTSHYHRLSDQEFTARHVHILHGLMQWLLFKDEAALQKTGEELGKRRFSDGVPLGQVVLVLVMVEKFLWQFLDASSEPVDPQTRRSVTEFFQKFAYYTAKGYEVPLAESNRLARLPTDHTGAAAQRKLSSLRKDAVKVSTERDMEISRGGQVGEHGG